MAVTWDGDVIAALTTSDGRSVTYERDGSARITGVSTHAGHLAYAWEGTLLTSVTDDDGVVLFVNVYDEAGRVVEQTSPFGRITTYTYQVPGATVIADDRGVRQAMVHDGRGNLTAVVDVDGSAMRITYDDADRAVRVVEQGGCRVALRLRRQHRRPADPPRSRRTPAVVDVGRTRPAAHRHRPHRRRHVVRVRRRSAHPRRVTGPDGSTATAELGPAGRPVTITDADGVVRRLEWDTDGQLTRITDAVGAVTTFEFDAAGLLVRLVDPAGIDTHLQYEHGRVSRSVRGDAVATYLRTPAGRIRGGTEPGDLPWTATLGPHGAIESITDAMGSTARYRVRLAR